MGCAECRPAYRDVVKAYMDEHADELCDDCKRRAETTPLRACDCKKEACAAGMDGAPKIADYLCDDCREHYETVKRLVEAAGISFIEDPRLVRGLDYYNHTVFERITDKLGAQGTICGGGRYDPLIEMLGGRPAPGVGFAMGMERVIELMRECGRVPVRTQPDVYVIHSGGDTQVPAMLLAEALRDAGVRVMVHPGKSGFKSQMKKADARGARFAVFAAEDALAAGTVSVKALREGEKSSAEQPALPLAGAAAARAAALAA